MSVLKSKRIWKELIHTVNMESKTFKCCICDELILNEYGNNPWPVKDTGKCCNICNETEVIPARIDYYLAG